MLIVEGAGFAATILLRRMTIFRTVTIGYSATPDTLKFYLKTARETTIHRAITRIEQSIVLFNALFVALY